MKLILSVDKPFAAVGQAITIRLLALNDSFEPARLDRRLLIGPNPVPERPTGMPLPVSTEPSIEGQDVIVLNPFCCYGRERVFDNLPAGTAWFHAYLLESPTDRLLARHPVDQALLGIAADPLAVIIQ